MTRDERQRSLHESRWQDDWPVQTRGIPGADQRQVCVPDCLSQMRMNRLDCEGAGNTGVAAAHAVTDDIESEQRVGHKAILVMGPFKASIGFGAMQSFEGQTTSPYAARLCRQARSSFATSSARR
jgi:hypothetical protein